MADRTADRAADRAAARAPFAPTAPERAVRARSVVGALIGVALAFFGVIVGIVILGPLLTSYVGRLVAARGGPVRILAGRALLTTYQPDEGSAKTFCSRCGSNLFGGGWPESERTSVRLTTLDEPFEGRIGSHIFVRSLAPWEVLPEDGADRYEVRAP